MVWPVSSNSPRGRARGAASFKVESEARNFIEVDLKPVKIR
jgi:hypothetical protein